MEDKYHLERFKEAQAGGVYEQALSEIRSGHKKSHWMWFIFPQIKGLGFSPTARFFEIKSLAEAQAYLDDSLLGSRLREISSALLEQGNSDPYKIFGYPDDMKLHSSMTLFDHVSQNDIFAKILDKFY